MKLTVEIDTNKATYRGEFSTLEELVEFYNDTFDRIEPDNTRVVIADAPPEPPYSNDVDG